MLNLAAHLSFHDCAVVQQVIVGCTRVARTAAVENQRMRAFRMSGGERDGHLAALPDSEECGAFRADLVQHGPDLFDAVIDRRAHSDAIGKAEASLVRRDEARPIRKPTDEASESRVTPSEFQMREIGEDRYEVDRPVAEQCVCDESVSATHVLHVGLHGPMLTYRKVANFRAGTDVVGNSDVHPRRNTWRGSHGGTHIPEPGSHEAPTTTGSHHAATDVRGHRADVEHARRVRCRQRRNPHARNLTASGRTRAASESRRSRDTPAIRLQLRPGLLRSDTNCCPRYGLSS